MKIKHDFINTIFKNAKRITKIEQGLSNNNYLVTTKYNEKLVVRIASSINNSLFNRQEEYNIMLQLRPFNIDVALFYFDQISGDKVTLYIENSYHKDDYTFEDIENIAVLIKKFHSLDLTCSEEFKPVKKYESYLYEIDEVPDELKHYNKLIKLFKEYYKESKKILCHNDIVRGNLLFANKKIYLIDYEFAAKNDLMFDLASFISENNIDEPSKQLHFLKTYFKDEFNEEIFNKFKIYICFEDLLWSTWAYMRYEQTKEDQFMHIYNQKINRLKSNFVL